jgi:hypothetical protein
MPIGWTKFAVAAVLFGAVLALSACQNRPGYNAYGRYPNDTLRPTTSDDDWFKDIGV